MSLYYFVANLKQKKFNLIDFVSTTIGVLVINKTVSQISL